MLPFRKINITTMAARLGKRDLLELAMNSGYGYMSTLDGQTPMTLAQTNNDYKTLTYLMESFIEFDTQYFTLRDNDELLLNFQNKFKDIFNCFFKPAQYTDNALLWVQSGIIGSLKNGKSEYFMSSDNKNVSKQMIDNCVSLDNEHNVVQIKTFKIKFCLEFGSQALNHNLKSFYFAPNAFKETQIALIVDYLWEEHWWRVFSTYSSYLVM